MKEIRVKIIHCSLFIEGDETTLYETLDELIAAGVNEGTAKIFFLSNYSFETLGVVISKNGICTRVISPMDSFDVIESYIKLEEVKEEQIYIYTDRIAEIEAEVANNIFITEGLHKVNENLLLEHRDIIDKIYQLDENNKNKLPLEKFLDKEEIKEQFLYNCKNIEIPSYIDSKIIKTVDLDLIYKECGCASLGVFWWYLTNEGLGYWQAMSDKFRKYIKTL